MKVAQTNKKNMVYLFPIK